MMHALCQKCTHYEEPMDAHQRRQTNAAGYGKDSHSQESYSDLHQRRKSMSKSKMAKRYSQALLGFMCFFVVFWMRTSFETALLYVYEHKAKEHEGHWTAKEVQIIDSSLHWSFAAAQIPAAFLVTLFSAHKMMTATVALSSILHIALYWTLAGDATVVIMVRIIQGFVEASLYPSAIGIWRHWAPPSERSLLVAIMISGEYFATFFGVLLNFYLISSLDVKMSFCISGAVGLVCSLMWGAMTYETPSSHPSISPSELSYLKNSLCLDDKFTVTLKAIPWKHLLTSLPVMAICVTSVFCYWSWSLVVFTSVFFVIPSPTSGASHIVMILPNLIMGLFILIGGYLSDVLIKKTFLSSTIVRKIFCSGGFTIFAIFLRLAESSNSFRTSVMCINVASGILGLSLAGFLANPLDLSPQYASLMMGFCAAWGSLGGVIFPFVLLPLGMHFEMDNWKWMFLSTSITCLIGALLYALFGSAEKQEWSESPLPTYNCRGNASSASFYPSPASHDSSALVSED